MPLWAVVRAPVSLRTERSLLNPVGGIAPGGQANDVQVRMLRINGR